jgi:hypothetical protein
MTLHTSLFSLIAIMDLSKARSFVYRFVLPRLYDVPLEDVLPFRDPFSILCDYMRKCEKANAAGFVINFNFLSFRLKMLNPD